MRQLSILIVLFLACSVATVAAEEKVPADKPAEKKAAKDPSNKSAKKETKKESKEKPAGPMIDGKPVGRAIALKMGQQFSR